MGTSRAERRISIFRPWRVETSSLRSNSQARASLWRCGGRQLYFDLLRLTCPVPYGETCVLQSLFCDYESVSLLTGKLLPKRYMHAPSSNLCPGRLDLVSVPY